jgi:hypothetical protein
MEDEVSLVDTSALTEATPFTVPATVDSDSEGSANNCDPYSMLPSPRRLTPAAQLPQQTLSVVPAVLAHVHATQYQQQQQQPQQIARQQALMHCTPAGYGYAARAVIPSAAHAVQPGAELLKQLPPRINRGINSRRPPSAPPTGDETDYSDSHVADDTSDEDDSVMINASRHADLVDTAAFAPGASAAGVGGTLSTSSSGSGYSAVGPVRMEVEASHLPMHAGAASSVAMRVSGRPAKPSYKLGPGSGSVSKSFTKKKTANNSTGMKMASNAAPGHACSQCGTQVTPVWRAGPLGPKTLCNACGVRWMKQSKRK